MGFLMFEGDNLIFLLLREGKMRNIDSITYVVRLSVDCVIIFVNCLLCMSFAIYGFCRSCYCLWVKIFYCFNLAKCKGKKINRVILSQIQIVVSEIRTFLFQLIILILVILKIVLCIVHNSRNE